MSSLVAQTNVARWECCVCVCVCVESLGQYKDARPRVWFYFFYLKGSGGGKAPKRRRCTAEVKRFLDGDGIIGVFFFFFGLDWFVLSGVCLAR